MGTTKAGFTTCVVCSWISCQRPAAGCCRLCFRLERSSHLAGSSGTSVVWKLQPRSSIAVFWNLRPCNKKTRNNWPGWVPTKDWSFQRSSEVTWNYPGFLQTRFCWWSYFTDSTRHHYTAYGGIDQKGELLKLVKARCHLLFFQAVLVIWRVHEPRSLQHLRRIARITTLGLLPVRIV